VRAIISRPGHGERFVRENRTITIRLDLPELSIHEIEFDTTFAVARHSHSHVDAMYVLDGQVEFLDGDDIGRVGAGALIAARPGTRHGFRNPGPGRARVLVLHAPDGGFAQIVRET
jgi:quercetin dioxygenase-like cupin family protein